MKRMVLFFVLMSLLSVSCNKSDGGSSSKEQVDPVVVNSPVTESPATPSIPAVNKPSTNSSLPALAESFDTDIELVNFTAEQEEKYNKAIEIVKMVVATEAFRSQVLNFTYAGKKAFVENKGRTNQQIYQSILDAAETLQPAKNNTMNLEVELYYAANNVVGYTYPTSKRIWVNKKFFNSYQENSVAGNLFHEWLHKLGYTHPSSATTSRPYTVPYAIGYIMSNIGKKFL